MTSHDDNDPLLMPRQKHLGERAFHLRVVDEFLTQMELSLLKVPAEPFDFAPIRISLSDLRELADDENPDRRKRVEFQLAHELLRWQENLAARDAKIEAYHIRRYCDGLRKPLDSEVFVALTRFYRDIPRSKNSQSKFDLALTRAFSISVSDLYRSMTMSRDEIGERLSSLYCSWDRVRSVDAGSPRDVSGFDKFIAENDNLLDFRSLTASRLFDRIREFKGELGDRFWDPAVAAAAVECNIVVGNHLNGLMARASENLGERLGSEFDFAGAFQDSSHNTGTYISDALRTIGQESPELLPDLEQESEDLRLLRSLLALSDSVGPDEGSVGSQTRNTEDSTLSIDEPQFREMLAALAQHNPDARRLTAFAAGSDLGGGFELDDFLFREDQQPDTQGREVLAVLLSLESFRQNELHDRKVLPILVRNRVLHSLAQAEDLGRKIEAAIADDPGSAGRRLRIANRLLETRLRTERSIVKFTSRGLGEVVVREADAFDEMDLDQPTLGPLNYASASASRWLIALTIGVALFTGILYYSTGDVGAGTGDGVETLESSQLPGGRDISNAYREGKTLYVVAKDSWQEKSDSEKTRDLRELTTAPTKEQVDRVLVIAQDGTPLGELSDKGIRVVSEKPKS